MISGVTFQTKARTVDHLGREQIADTPTAISELWKNAFDAYARHVELNIYDGAQSLATIVDDGHGMNRDEFINRWLVVGTESKVAANKSPVEDRNGLRVRPRQGQKGIGRLSCANLGPVLLFISKRVKEDFVVSLVDWRLFENPFLNLSDISIPVTEISDKKQLFDLLPDLVADLMQNVQGAPDSDRRKRIEEAWAAYDSLVLETARETKGHRATAPSAAILDIVQGIPFAERHLENWVVWSEQATHGTALVVSNINYDLQIQLDETINDDSAKSTKDRFFQTLSSFVDPFVDPAHPEANAFDPQFTYAVKTWADGAPKLVLGSEKQFNRHMIEPMEHIIEGTVDATGAFQGRIKAFGEWLPDQCIIEPSKNLKIPNRADTRVGPFDVFIASMEFVEINSTHTRAEHQRFKDLAERYAGFMIFRDGLRVLPYGRADNDFFEIETRRSKQAGREFWNHRQMFGRLAIGRRSNPNLKDKAGREGLLDNRAAKALKGLVENILTTTARRYFGSASKIRHELLPEIKDANKRERATEARNKLRKKQRKQFRTKLKTLSKEMPFFSSEISAFISNLEINTEADIAETQKTLDNFKARFSEFRLPGAPKNLGTLEDTYLQFREELGTAKENLNSLEEKINAKITQINPPDPKSLLENQLARNAARIHSGIRKWKNSIDNLQKAEFARIRDLIDQRNKLFHAEATPLIHQLETERLNYAEASKIMELLMIRLESENADLFGPYISALESLQESIDLEHLASFGMEEVSELRSELERLNSLAQLGIAVEIVGHELQSYDEIIGSGLSRLPDEIRKSKAVKDINFGYEGLTDQLRFLSPLRLAGPKIQKWITGEEIHSYLADFFKIPLSKNHVKLHATDSFERFRVFDQQSRLFPVFINLINNSLYWLAVSTIEKRQIILDVIDSEIVISDNGPGVDPEDVENLFTLFFTKKNRGGRGVGLYLCRANLAAGGHRIRYVAEAEQLPLPGANFVIEFRGAEFDGK